MQRRDPPSPHPHPTFRRQGAPVWYNPRHGYKGLQGPPERGQGPAHRLPGPAPAAVAEEVEADARPAGGLRQRPAHVDGETLSYEAQEMAVEMVRGGIEMICT